MSAREELVAGLSEHSCCFGGEDAEKLVDAFAHELAELQRASGLDQSCGGIGCCGEHGGVADLIDPHKQRTEESTA